MSGSMHPSVERALEEIDAAVFSGDTFEDDEAREDLLAMIERWRNELYQPDGFESLDPLED